MSSSAIIGLVAANLGLLFLLLAAPLGVRTVTFSRMIRAPRGHVWSALYPLGANAGWSDEIVGATLLGADGDGVRTARLMLFLARTRRSSRSSAPSCSTMSWRASATACA